MIDTIRFSISIKKKLYDEIRQKSVEFSKTDNELQKQFIRILSKKFPAGSYDYFINLKLYNESTVYLEFSLPKVYFGHNVFMIAPEQCSYIVQTVYSAIKTTFPSFPDPIFWLINRVDFCYAWKLPSENVATQIIEILRSIQMKRKKTKTYDTSIMFYGRTQSYKFYCKHPEFYEHDFKELKKTGRLDLAYNFLQISEGVLRFEITLRNKALVHEFYGYDCPDDNYICLTDDIFNTKRIETVLKKYIYKIFKLTELSFMDNNTVFNKLKEHYSLTEARHLFLFYSFLFSDDPTVKDILKIYTRYQTYRNLRKIREAGVGISCKTMQIGFNFNIPSEYSVNNIHPPA